jgi:hypothetical protein
VAEGEGAEPLREIFVHSGSIGEIIPDLDDLAGKVSRFARGEIVAPAVPAVAGGAAGEASAAVPSAELQDLTQRVESLEESVTQILESQDGDEGAAKLR